MQTLGQSVERVTAVSRVALNLKGLPAEQVHRGAALVTPGAWAPTRQVDARCTAESAELPGLALLHLGSGAFPVRVRSLERHVVRLTFDTDMLLEPGDRGILRNPGIGRLEGGVEVLDVGPPEFRRRGAAARRGEELADTDGLPDVGQQVARRGAIRIHDLERLGVPVDEHAPVRREGEWLVSHQQWQDWTAGLRKAVQRNDDAHPLQPGLTLGAARRTLEVPDDSLLLRVAAAAGLETSNGRIQQPGSQPTLGAAEAGIAALEKRLSDNAFAAPERPDLLQLKLGRAELAAAERVGRILRLPDDVILLPSCSCRRTGAAAEASAAVHHQCGPGSSWHQPPGGDSAARALGPVGLDHLCPAGVQDHCPWRSGVTRPRF